MAEKIINNPSLLPSDLAFELSGNTITAISGHPIAGSGGGTVSDLVYYPVFDNSNGNVTFHLGTSAHGPEPGGAWHISGATGPQGIQGKQGIQGIQGIPGIDGKNPVFEINSSDAHWRWKYAEATSGWTDLGVVASGAVGPKGNNGTNGVTPGVRINTSTNKWEIADDGVTWVSTNINATGPQGTKGDNGVSPTISTTPITDDPDHPQGGTKVTVTDSTGSEEFKIWNGNDGQGATVNLLEGTGIKIEKIDQDYTIGVSGDYASTSDVEAASANAYDKAVANLTYYYKKTETSSTSEITNALSTKLDSTVAEQTYQPKGNYATTSDISDMATQTWVGRQGFLKNTDLTDYATKTYANEASANALSEAKTWVGQRGFITKDVNDLTYYYKKTETSGSTELSTEFAKKVNNPDTALTDKYLVLRTDTNGAVSGWCNFNDKIYSKSESDGRYMQKNTDSTLSGDGTTNSPLGIDTTNMAASKQYAFTTTGWQLVSVPTIPDITANNGLSANGHTVGIDDTNIAANTQYAWTTSGWKKVDGYLSTAGGTVSGQLVVSGGDNFDQQFLKITRENVNGYGRIGLGSSGPLAFKVDDASSHTTQINISPNTTNDQLVQVQHNSNTVGYLIPAIIEQAGWTPSTDDKILHIVLASE